MKVIRLLITNNNLVDKCVPCSFSYIVSSILLIVKYTKQRYLYENCILAIRYDNVKIDNFIGYEFMIYV